MDIDMEIRQMDHLEEQVIVDSQIEVPLEIQPKFIKSGSLNPEDEPESVMIIDTSTKQEENLKTCKLCNLGIQEEDLTNNQVIDFTLSDNQCFHIYHNNCLKSFMLFEYTSMKDDHFKFQCEMCCLKISDKQISELHRNYKVEQELQDKLYQESLKVIQAKMQQEKEEREMKIQLMKQFNLVECKCGAIMEVETVNPDFTQKDKLGNKISEQSAHHMSQHRIRCYQCSQNFCTECSVYPYHLGYTCETYHHYLKTRECRFCKQNYKDSYISEHAVFDDVCIGCAQYAEQSCHRQYYECNHKCYGARGEENCLPCLHPECVAKNEAKTLGSDMNSTCPVCYTDTFSQQCKSIIRVSRLSLLRSINGMQIRTRDKQTHRSFIDDGVWLFENVRKQALERAVIEGIDKDERLANPEDRFYNDLQEYALYKLAFYQCFDCKKPYFGGKRDCEQEALQENIPNKEDYKCGRCKALTFKSGITNCDVHGEDFIEYKCQYCCHVALWFCWGTHRFCEPCHDDAANGHNEVVPCKGSKECPLNGHHNTNGQEYAIGCRLCRNDFIEQQNIQL
ncbi:myc binding protein 2 [Stylonychia lemnae]|uniref:Myc binding protein 2 n=1 Tax=Stylonychia lemnae TaxID=5949 RepID=A0A078ATB2_STYLE|nr:myc binding protein 2 [Stylonychia lemnae]|eukprot:CDW84412.1 myc binding protein 2 [Stylonychia lemnae]